MFARTSRLLLRPGWHEDARALHAAMADVSLRDGRVVTPLDSVAQTSLTQEVESTYTDFYGTSGTCAPQRADASGGLPVAAAGSSLPPSSLAELSLSPPQAASSARRRATRATSRERMRMAGVCTCRGPASSTDRRVSSASLPAYCSLPSSTVGRPRRNVATTWPGSSRPAYGVLRLSDADSLASTTRRTDGS